MKKYSKPVIKVIQIDPNQAVLQVCKVDGAYFFATQSICLTDHDGWNVCGRDIRGKAADADNLENFEFSGSPS